MVPGTRARWVAEIGERFDIATSAATLGRTVIRPAPERDLAAAGSSGRRVITYRGAPEAVHHLPAHIASPIALAERLGLGLSGRSGS